MDLGLKHIGKRRAMEHAFFWLAWVFTFTLLQCLGQGFASFGLWLKYYLVTLPVFMLHTYLIAYWLVPVAFYKNRYGWFILGFVVLLPVFSVIELVVSNELVFRSENSKMAFEPDYLNFKNILISGLGNQYIILVFLAIKVGRAWYRAQSQKNVEQNWNRRTELEIYHYQLQPRIMLHLMEMLGLALKMNPRKSSEVIIVVSDFLNRFIDEKNEKWLPLNKETELIKLMLKIHHLASGKPVNMRLETEGNHSLLVIPAGLFLPLVNFAIITGQKCNNSVNSSVFIGEENRELHFCLEMSSNNEFNQSDNYDFIMLGKRLQYNFPGKYRLQENYKENYLWVNLEVFP